VLLDAAPESIIGFDRLGVCTFCNPASLAIFAAASAADLVGKPIRELLARVVDQEVAAHIAHAVERGVAVDLPVVELARGGARPPIFACWVRPKLYGTNYIGRVVGFMDITERIRQHQELDHERRRLSAVLDSIEVGVIACDSNGEMVIYNRAMTRINGLADDATTAEKMAARANWRYPGAEDPPPPKASCRYSGRWPASRCAIKRQACTFPARRHACWWSRANISATPRGTPWAP
jgi:PAS domain-containing protein